MRTLYSILLVLGSPFVLLYFVLRGLRDKTYLQRWPERLGFVRTPGKPGGILVHAASVGEVNASRALIKALSVAYPDHAITVSTLTPTGSTQARRELGERVASCYIPLDVSWAVARFLNHLQPSLIIVIETEIWPNLYFAAQQRGIPLVMANARLSERSANRYRMASGFIAQTLQKVTWIGAQSADDQRRLIECGAGAEVVHLTGNLKFDLNVSASLKEKSMALRVRWGHSRPVLVAGSTHEDDENVVIPAFMHLLREYPDALLILVPRHPERFGRVAQLTREAGLRTELYSQGEACSPQAQCFVVDTIGELMTYYACGDVAFVGGSMGEQGGHNALEPAALGVPVLLGPNMDNAREIADQLIGCRAAQQINGWQDLLAASEHILADAGLRDRMGQAGRTLVAQNRGALDVTLKAVKALM